MMAITCSSHSALIIFGGANWRGGDYSNSCSKGGSLIGENRVFTNRYLYEGVQHSAKLKQEAPYE